MGLAEEIPSSFQLLSFPFAGMEKSDLQSLLLPASRKRNWYIEFHRNDHMCPLFSKQYKKNEGKKIPHDLRINELIVSELEIMLLHIFFCSFLIMDYQYSR